MIKKILCPTDFSAGAARALEYGAQLARKFDASLVVLHVVPTTAYPLRNMGAVSGFPNLHDEIMKRVDQEMEDACKTLEGVQYETKVAEEGPPHRAILDMAADEECDLIVMGTDGHTGIAHVLLGSTAERVVRLSEIPVLTLRGPRD